MLLADLAATSDNVAATRSRLEKIRLLTECLARLSPAEMHPAVAFLSGELRQGKIGIGYSAVREVAPADAAGEPSLTIVDVDRELDRIPTISGKGSKAAKVAVLHELLLRATRQEQRFLTRLLIGELRQGALEGVMLEAVAKASGRPAEMVRRAFMLGGNLVEVAVAALTGGEDALSAFALELFQPLQPMLAKPSGSVSEAIAKLDDCALEWKLDGARVQVHRDGDEVRVYTRKLNDVTLAVPEIVEATRNLPVGRIVLDGEAIALRADTKPHPFQVTMRRFGRRLDVARMREELPLSVFFFDCLHLDGSDLIDLEGQERFAAFSEVLPGELVVPRLVTGDPEAAGEFFEDALERGHEGVLVKDNTAPYEAGRRGSGWLKVKPAHTLDLVVLAAEWGSGRRKGWLSNLHLGARGPDGFVMLGKTFKGMTDEMLEWQTRRLQELEVGRDDYTVYVAPELVVEVAFDGVQASPQYPGGVALRFARVKRYRSDKTASEADTIETVLALLEG